MRHQTMILAAFLVVVYISSAYGAAIDNEQESRTNDLETADASERLFFTSNALNFGGNGATSITIGNAGYVVLGAYILIPLIIGLALLFYLLGGQGDRGYGGDSYHVDSYGSTGSSYGSYARSFDPYAIDWQKFSILDWISIGEEAYRKFDPSDLDCQKRLICEVHQNTSKFGAAASKMVDLFSYLQYAEVLSLPDEFKALVEEYLDAADRGRSLQKECGEVYNSCEFSVKSMVDRYSHNEI